MGDPVEEALSRAGVSKSDVEMAAAVSVELTNMLGEAGVEPHVCVAAALIYAGTGAALSEMPKEAFLAACAAAFDIPRNIDALRTQMGLGPISEAS